MYIAILGRQPALGIAELERLYQNVRWHSKESALFQADSFSIERVGGSQKAGRVIATLPNADWKKVSFRIVNIYSKKWAESDKKITLGISVYGFNVSPRDVQKTGLILKGKLKDSSGSLRLIPNQDTFLNSASSHHNKLGLSDSKVELLVVKGSDGSAIIAESVGAQNITALAARDQGRPKRDAFVGMLPPKLAQIMINLAAGSDVSTPLPSSKIPSESSRRSLATGPAARATPPSLPLVGSGGVAPSSVTRADVDRIAAAVERSSIIGEATLDPESEPTPGLDSDPEGSSGFGDDGRRANEKKDLRLLDPFCGTGVILQEAAILGYEVYGTDLAEKMIRYSRDNLNWLAETYTISPNWYLNEGDATDTKWQQPIDLVAAETYLGQPFSAPPSPAKLVEVRGNCNHIIKAFLKNIGGQLKAGTPLCLAVPAWRDTDGNVTHLPLIDEFEKLGYKQLTLTTITHRQLIYFREDQVVARELLLLEKL